MGDYETLDLGSWCNVSAEWVTKALPIPVAGWLPKSGDFPKGQTEFRGLPFRIGELLGKPGFLGFGPLGYDQPVEIAVGQCARWVIFAHRLLESRLHEGEPVGRHIATYRFRYADGTEVPAPIRERFEISVVPPRWGQLPFLAVPDQPDCLMPRDAGLWEKLGNRQTEVEMPWPQWFVLWAWQNPYPTRELASLCIEPNGRMFLIAGMTLSSLDEDPFGRGPLLPMTVHLEEPVPTDSRFDLSVGVDRGVASYLYPLPTESKEDFLNDGLRGWGQERVEQSNRAYSFVAASPSATLRLRRGDEEIAAVRWGDVVERGQVQAKTAKVEVLDRGKNWVHVTVLDQDTGEPIPCRVHFRSPEGIPYQPHGHHDHLLSDKGTWHIDVGGDVRLGHVTYAYIDGKCQGWLPRGEVLVDVARGFEYEPLRTAVEIRPGQRELTLFLKRRLNMAERRWFSGDSHVHFLSTTGALLEGQAEDLNVVNLLQSQWGHLFTNTEDFCGRAISAPGGRTVVYTSQENRQHMLGHLTLLGLRQPVMPWCTGGPDEAELGGSLETTLCHWADECHAQDGTVIVPHMPDPNCEIAALIATGRADALEMAEHDMFSHVEYYRYLNGGYRLPLVGGTDKMSAGVPVGLFRTYVHIPPDEEFNYDNWCKNLRLGRTFLSSGPMLHLTVEGASIGDTLCLPGTGGMIEVLADAESIFPIHTLEIVQEGRVVASTSDLAGAKHLRLRARLQVSRHTWLAARVSGPGYTQPLLHRDDLRRGVMAHTSPVYIAVGDEWWMYSQDTAQYMLTLLHGGLEYIRCRSRQHPPHTVTHHHAEEDHLVYLERPFQEALRKIQTRMQSLGAAKESSSR